MELNKEIIKLFNIAVKDEFTDLLSGISDFLGASTEKPCGVELAALWNMPCREPLYLNVKPNEKPISINFNPENKKHFVEWRIGEESGRLYCIDENNEFNETVIEAVSSAIRINIETAGKKVAWGTEAAERILGITFHDVRNTFGSVTGVMQLLKMDESENERVQSSLDSINDILNNFDEPNKITMLILRNEPIPYKSDIVDISSIYNTILTKNKRAYSYSQIDLEFQVAPNIKTTGDEPKITQILTEFLFNASNSIENCKEGGKITVDVSLVDSFCVINVKDTGLGMDYDSQRYITNKFFTRKYKRPGLGIPRIRRYVEDWGGYLIFESEQKKGTSITAKFPIVL
ncbi:MAG: sensor histidine kinase [Chitinispirillales bacterium]|jgi:signal transduction histidine kinase|nr:sensor histidine kinase [Chitinispirillales bacterium]